MYNKLTEGIYVPNIEAVWLYKENLEHDDYIINAKHLGKLLSGKLDYSLELIENEELLNNIEIVEKNGRLYTLDIVNVKYNNKYSVKGAKKSEEMSTKQLRYWSYINGFKFNGKLMKNWKRSSGKAREGQCLFTLDSIVDKCNDWARMGLEFDGEVDIASVRAYESLTLSSIIGTIDIDAANILVIDDYNSIFNWEMSETSLINKELVTKTVVVEESNSIWDGQGLMDVSVFNDNELIKGKGMALLRQKYFKCCTFSANLSKFYTKYCNENGLDYNTYAIDDMYGNSILVKEILFITTPNSIKIAKFNDEVLKMEGYKDLEENLKAGAWLQYWKDNVGSTFGICKTEKPSRFENGKYNRLSYQKINTIPFITRKEVTELVSREVEYVEKLKDDLDFFMQEANIDVNESLDTDTVHNIDVIGAFNELVKTNVDFAKTQVFKDYRRNFISSHVRDLRQGRIRIEGDYATLCGNGIEMLYATVGEFTGKAITLVDNQVYCPKFADGEVIAGFRDPHICEGNIANLINVENDIISKYINATDNIAVINAINYPIQTIWQGQDYDSDTALLTNNKTIIKACARLNWNNTPIPVPAIANTGKNNAEINGVNMSNIDHIISQNYIGQDVNLSQQINSLFNHSRYNNLLTDEEVAKMYSKISKTSSISTVEIDKAKKQFQDLDVPRELAKMKEGMKTVSDTDARIVLPRFFQYIGDNDAKKKKAITNKKHREELDEITKVEYALANNTKVEDVAEDDKKLKKLYKKNDIVQKTWEEQEYEALDTPMDWLQEEVDGIKEATRMETIQVIQLIKENRNKYDNDVVNKVVSIIEKTDIAIEKYRSNGEIEYTDRKFKIDREKYNAVKEIRKIGLNKANIYKVMQKCLNSVKKNGKVKNRSGIESLTLEILFAVEGTRLISMFESKKQEDSQAK